MQTNEGQRNKAVCLVSTVYYSNQFSHKYCVNNVVYIVYTRFDRRRFTDEQYRIEYALNLLVRTRHNGLQFSNKNYVTNAL